LRCNFFERASGVLVSFVVGVLVTFFGVVVLFG